MSKTGRILVKLICLAILLAVIFSAFLAVAEADHDCAGEHCAVCRMIGQTLRLLRTVALAAVFPLGTTACTYRLGAHRRTGVGRRQPTPVSLRVKLTD